MLNKELYYNKNFLLILSISLATTASLQIYTLVIPVLIYDITNSALAMSTMRIFDFLPNIVFGMFIGVLVDKFNRKVILKYVAIVRLLLSISLILFIISNDLNLFVLYALGFLISLASFTFGNAQNAIVPQLFRKEQITDIQSNISFLNTTFSVIGPSVVGLLIATSSYQNILIVYVMIISLLFLFSSLLDNVKTPEYNSEEKFWTSFKEGLRTLFEEKILLYPTVAILITNLTTSLVIGVQVYYLLDTLESTKQQLGLALSIGAAGGLIGPLLLGYLRKKWTRGKIFIMMFKLDVVTLLLYFFATEWWHVGILLSFRSLAVTIVNIIYLSLRQEMTPNNLLGRVSGTTSMFMKLMLPIGLFIGGIWAEYLPVNYIFIIAALILTINIFFLRKKEFVKFQ